MEKRRTPIEGLLVPNAAFKGSVSRIGKIYLQGPCIESSVKLAARHELPHVDRLDYKAVHDSSRIREGPQRRERSV